ncbi:MAG: cytochrome c biogenesis CcdA family protein [Acidimicrobiales bacterium]
MIDAPLALGYAAGMLAAFNPCGFALMPAYLAFFLGADDDAAPSSRPVAGALAVGAAVTVGFVVVFGLAGLATTSFSFAVQRAAPWVSVPIGLGRVGRGIVVAAGWNPAVRLPRLAVGGSRGGFASMALYGASYATVSLSCTLPVFLAAVATTFEDTSLLSGLAVFVAYALGMGTVLTGLAVAIGLARRPIGSALRRATPIMARAGGVLLAVAGAYVAWYAIYELRLERDDNATAGPVITVTRWSGQVSNWIAEVGTGTIAIAVVVLATLVALAGRRRGRRDGASPRSPRRGGAAAS